ncbi:MAG TPA: pyridoxamine 5'-phosphate oxidase family protein [Mycobacteriales bacterium]|nr:pyridoxamine 5'-phosphate oxidase family protein [Mycobacteriales bacterium]
MADPVESRLDPRFSDSAADATSWDDTLRVLDQAELFWVTTVRPDGRPHVTPLVAVWSGGALYFCTGLGEQKEVNLRRNSRVILMTGRNDWDQGLDVVVEGEAERVTDRDRLEQVAEVWTEKWDGRWQYVVTDTGFEHSDDPDHNQVLVFAVHPDRVLAFGKGTFSHTSHRFS